MGDIFAERCLHRIGVKGKQEVRLLLENKLMSTPDALIESINEHLKQNEEYPHHIPQRCQQGFAGYHPYKTEERYLRCYSQAAFRTYGNAMHGTYHCSQSGSMNGKGYPLHCPFPPRRLRSSALV